MTDKDFIPQPPEDDQVWAQGAKDTKEGTDVPKEGAPAQASESTELEQAAQKAQPPKQQEAAEPPAQKAQPPKQQEAAEPPAQKAQPPKQREAAEPPAQKAQSPKQREAAPKPKKKWSHAANDKQPPTPEIDSVEIRLPEEDELLESLLGDDAAMQFEVPTDRMLEGEALDAALDEIEGKTRPQAPGEAAGTDRLEPDRTQAPASADAQLVEGDPAQQEAQPVEGDPAQQEAQPAEGEPAQPDGEDPAHPPAQPQTGELVATNAEVPAPPVSGAPPKPPKPPRKPLAKKWKVLIACIAGLLVVLGAATAWAFVDQTPDEAKAQQLMQSGVIYSNISIAGVNVGDMTAEQARQALQAAGMTDPDRIELEFTSGEDTWTIKGSEIGVVVDLDAAIEQAMLVDKTGSMIDQWQTRDALNKQAKDIPLATDYDDSLLTERLAAIADEATVAPVEPSIYVDENGKLAVGEGGKDGRVVDADTLIADVTQRMEAGDYSAYELKAEITQPTTTQADLNENVTLIATHTTNCSGSSGRLFNVRKTLGLINGKTVRPGEIFDINAVLGPRTVAGGWKEAPGIADGNKYTQQAGGGVCQVSSTLYYSALLADLEIVERRPHSWPAAYMPIGLDATISTGGPNLRFKNTLDENIYIIAYANSGTSKVTVSIYGPARTDGLSVKLSSERVSTWNPPAAKVTVDSSKPAGYKETVITPRIGQKAVSYKHYYQGDALVRTEVIATDTYNSVRGEYIVGPS